MGLPKIYDKKKALAKAKNKSEIEKSVLYVIQSSELSANSEIITIYYVDDNSVCRNHESVIATFECGVKI